MTALRKKMLHVSEHFNLGPRINASQVFFCRFLRLTGEAFRRASALMVASWHHFINLKLQSWIDCLNLFYISCLKSVTPLNLDCIRAVTSLGHINDDN